MDRIEEIQARYSMQNWIKGVRDSQVLADIVFLLDDSAAKDAEIARLTKDRDMWKRRAQDGGWEL